MYLSRARKKFEMDMILGGTSCWQGQAQFDLIAIGDEVTFCKNSREQWFNPNILTAYSMRWGHIECDERETLFKFACRRGNRQIIKAVITHPSFDVSTVGSGGPVSSMLVQANPTTDPHLYANNVELINFIRSVHGVNSPHHQWREFHKDLIFYAQTRLTPYMTLSLMRYGHPFTWHNDLNPNVAHKYMGTRYTRHREVMFPRLILVRLLCHNILPDRVIRSLFHILVNDKKWGNYVHDNISRDW